jgi:nucleosome binding factor SPN SPT16 subunit
MRSNRNRRNAASANSLTRSSKHSLQRSRTQQRTTPIAAECLVHLTDAPFLVITLKEVEVCHLERVQFGLKNFDMVFVFSDFTRAPVHINSIPMEQLDDVKLWLE